MRKEKPTKITKTINKNRQLNVADGLNEEIRKYRIVPFLIEENQFLQSSLCVLNNYYKLSPDEISSADFTVHKLYIPYYVCKIKYRVVWTANVGWYTDVKENKAFFKVSGNSGAVCGQMTGTFYCSNPVNDSFFCKKSIKCFSACDFSKFSAQTEKDCCGDSIFLSENVTISDINAKVRNLFENAIKEKLKNNLKKNKFSDIIYDRSVDESASLLYLPFYMLEYGKSRKKTTVISSGADLSVYCIKKI